jgi:hypothetical protein
MESEEEEARLRRGGFARPEALRPNQVANLRRFASESALGHGLLVADGMGYGKTITGLACASHARSACQASKLVVVSLPCGLEAQWKSEICAYTGWGSVRTWSEVKSAAAWGAVAGCARMAEPGRHKG